MEYALLTRCNPNSKLEQLEEELKSIKQVVHHNGGGEHSGGSHGHLHSPARTPHHSASLSEHHHHHQQQNHQQQQPLPAIPKYISEPPPATTPTPSSSAASPHAMRPTKAVASLPRRLGEMLVAGEDIDYYFDKLSFPAFHPMTRIPL